jgi:hypothetical protein
MTEGAGERPPSEGSAGPAPASQSSTGRVVGMIFTSIGGLIGLALLLGGIAVIAAYAFARDDDGYFTSDRKQLRTPTYAITTDKIDLGAGQLDWAPDKVLGDVRVQVESRKPVFVGIGRDAAVRRYLGRVGRAELVDFNASRPEIDVHPGSAPRSRPGAQPFWVAQAQGSGQQELTWDADFGSWTAVVMNANAARGIDVAADAGVKLGWVIWVGVGMLVVGLLICAGAVLLIAYLRRPVRPAPAPAR